MTKNIAIRKKMGIDRFLHADYFVKMGINTDVMR